MRLIVIGSASQRRDLREQLESSPPDVVGEFASLAQAQASEIPVDAYLVAESPASTAIDDIADVETLTPRELEVVELVAQGLSNKSIAVRLGISDQTVKFHLTSIMGKLGAANRTDAVRRAVRRGLITL